MSETRKLRTFLTGDVKKDQFVGCEDKDQTGQYAYRGPTARIAFDRTWLYIVTDDYEGHVMINIEALPQLRRALARVGKAIRAPTAKGEDDAENR